jgi:DNA-binding winged helix-turn-helix (wHTH) protein
LRLVGAKGESRLEPQVMRLLVYLAERQGDVASKEDIVRDVWEGAFVGDDALTYSVSQLRKALGDDSRRPTFVQTVARKGYILLPEVVWEASPVPRRARSAWSGGVASARVLALVALGAAVPLALSTFPGARRQEPAPGSELEQITRWNRPIVRRRSRPTESSWRLPRPLTTSPRSSSCPHRVECRFS